MFPITELIWMRVSNNKTTPTIITPKSFTWEPEDDYEWDECPCCGDMIVITDNQEHNCSYNE